MRILCAKWQGTDLPLDPLPLSTQAAKEKKTMKKLVIHLIYFEQVQDCSVQRERRFDSFVALYDCINHFSFLSGMQAGTINDVSIQWEFSEPEV